jgi:hypothetical protein
MRYIVICFLLISNLEANYKALLFNGNCTTCHFKNKTVSAPSVAKFKEVYIVAFPKKEDFVDYISKWVKKPNAKTSLMDDAIKKHGLMPELAFDLSTLKEITEYIYDTDFSS